jgi:hypothetical protein
MKSIPPLNITFNATQPNWPSHAISRVETSATQRKASMAIKNCSNGKLADSCTTALALSLSLALILACLSERKAGQLTSPISRYQIVPTHLKTPSYFGLMIPLRAMHSRQLSLTLPMFRETTLRGYLTRPSLIDLSYRRQYAGPTFSLSKSPGTWKCTTSRSQSMECHTPAYDFQLDSGLADEASLKGRYLPAWLGRKKQRGNLLEAG